MIRESFLPKASPDINPRSHGIERANKLQCSSDIKSAMRADIGLLPDAPCEFVAVPGYTNMLRPWSCIVEVTSEDTTVLGSYLIKPAHHIAEIDLSLRASQLGISPNVIYVNRGENIFVETFYPGEQGSHSITERAASLTPREEVIIGKKLARKTYSMSSNVGEDGWPSLQGGDYGQHLLLVGNGEQTEPVFVDWGQHRQPNTIPL